MKIYIEDFISPLSPSSQLILAKDNTKIKKILKKLEAYLFKKQNVVDIYSKQGVYQVNENQTHQLYVKTEKIHENIILKTHDGKNITLIIDDSVIVKELAHQIPFEHIKIPVTSHTYSLNKKNTHGVFLVIEYIEKYEGIIKPINYYFEYKQKNNDNSNCNNIPLEDINVFLSLLN
jgi:hypothetical protein